MRIETVFSLPNMRFKKTGMQIRTAVELLIASYNKDITKAKEEIIAICKKREIDADELVDVDDVHTFNRMSARYANDMETQSVGITANKMVKEMQADMQALRDLQHKVPQLFEFKEAYGKVVTHIEPERIFDLTYDELQKLGFEADPLVTKDHTPKVTTAKKPAKKGKKT